MLLVQKYGGTSVGTPDRIRAVAKRVTAARKAGNDLVVVVSAMGDSTDDLLQLASDVVGSGSAASRHPREMDMLLTAGERISMALLAMAIREDGEEALSLTGSQAAIITDGVHTAARITEVRGERVRQGIAEGQIVIVAGFQGVSLGREVTTLGRGGSDTTAVALAAALSAHRCEIYTDVPGVFTADPRRVPTARVVPELSYDEMLEMASAGAQVMHARAIEIAAKFNVDIRVLSSFEQESDTSAGTLITRHPRRMEELVLTGIASKKGQAKLVMRQLPPGLSSATAVLVALAEAGVSVDMVSEAQHADGRSQLEVTVGQNVLDEAIRVCEGVARGLGGERVDVQTGLTRLALVGSGMHERPGVFARTFRSLLEQEIDVHAVSTSGISITVLVKEEREEQAIRALHDAFALELISPTPMAAPPAGGA